MKNFSSLKQDIVLGYKYVRSLIMMRLGRKYVCVLGDSHSKVFEEINSLLGWRKYDVCSVNGATVSGIQNPNSVTNAKKHFDARIKLYKKNSDFIVLLGEVDFGFLFWHQVENKGVDKESLYAQVLGRYELFLRALSEKFIVTVVSAPLPTIKDGHDYGEVANFRRHIKASQRDKTEITLRFNADAENLCNKLGVNYINLDKVSLDKDTGVVRSSLLNKRSDDHHYDIKKYAEILIEEMK